MMDKFTVLIIMAAITSLLSMFVAVGSLWVYYIETPYVSYSNLPFPLINKRVYKPGDYITVSVGKCNSSNDTIFYSSVSAFSNATRKTTISLPSVPLVATPGCQVETADDMKIPLNTKSGVYYFYGLTTASGRFSTHDLPWTTESFTVDADIPKE